ncbi:hypothetical protein PTKIN_Ptkin05aG0112400 [Pterospermum kingtungense]
MWISGFSQKKWGIDEEDDLGLNKKLKETVPLDVNNTANTAAVVSAGPHESLMLEQSWKNASDMERFRVKWTFHACLSVDRIGSGGGLAMLWTEDIKLEIMSYSVHHIDVVIHEDNEKSWRFTGFYGYPETKEKIGGTIRPLRQMEEFGKVLVDCGLIKICFTGPMFTWRRGNRAEIVLERLDRRVANYEWLDLLPEVRERHIISEVSDHLSILFELHKTVFRSQEQKF